MGKFGYCASCYFYGKDYCSKYDIDIYKHHTGCNNHMTWDEYREREREQDYQEDEDNEDE